MSKAGYLLDFDLYNKNYRSECLLDWSSLIQEVIFESPVQFHRIGQNLLAGRLD
jgi:hypothetical protein